ncbi:MAG TPA: hypothetical protein VIP09_15990 [Dehalococcoidia bacterium]|jgi:hypothetical protein
MTTDLDTLPPFIGELDVRIAPLVHALRRDGFRTIGSCDGHGNPRVTPWVQVEWPEPLDHAEAYALVERLLNWFASRDVYANVSMVYGNYGQDEGANEPNRFIRVEIFDDLIREAFGW